MLPVFLITWIGGIVFLVRHPSIHSAWLVVFLTAASLAVTKTRTNALKVQDRIIRLEERLRLAQSLLPQDQRHYIDQLNEGQLIALRFRLRPGSAGPGGAGGDRTAVAGRTSRKAILILAGQRLLAGLNHARRSVAVC